MSCFHNLVFNSPHRIAMPVAVYPGLALTGASVSDAVSNPAAQVEAQVALYERYHTPVVLSAMDLSVEAEAFGCAVQLSETEMPTVTGRLVAGLEEARRLAVPRAGDKRTAVHLEVVRRLHALPGRPVVLSDCIGPFSLAARLVGVSEAMELTLTEPDLMQLVIEKCTRFLIDYLRALRAAGADGALMAEPAAGLLSPRGMAEFSSSWIRTISGELADADFTLVLHNCAAKLVHLPALLHTGLKTFHFGSPMDLGAALGRVPSDVVLCGNLDPSAVFCQLPPAEISARVSDLLNATAGQNNHVLSSGCDLPPGTPLASLDAFFAAARPARAPQA